MADEGGDKLHSAPKRLDDRDEGGGGIFCLLRDLVVATDVPA